MRARLGSLGGTALSYTGGLLVSSDSTAAAKDSGVMSVTADRPSTLDHLASQRGVVFVKADGTLAILLDPTGDSADMSVYRPIGQVLHGCEHLAIHAAAANAVMVADCSLARAGHLSA